MQLVKSAKLRSMSQHTGVGIRKEQAGDRNE